MAKIGLEDPVYRVIVRSRQEVITMTKSNIFHESLRYAFLPIINPRVIILTVASSVYMTVMRMLIKSIVYIYVIFQNYPFHMGITR